jgi:predicted permease
MQTLADDVRYAWRVMGKAPGFAAASVFMLAIGIGANTAIFTIIDAVLLRPLPFPQSQQLVRITADLTGRGARDVGVSAQELVDYQQQGDLFASVSGDYPINENLTGTDEPERLEGQLVSASYFDLLGAHARLGRVFGPQDYAPGVAEVAVISDGLWKRRFGQDPNIVGRKIRLDNDLFTIIGVMPPGFRHPGRRIQGEPEIWSPCGYRATPFPAPLRSTFLLSGVIARLQPGVSVAAAQARIDVLGAVLRRQYPGDYPSDMGWRPRIEPLQDSLTGSARQPLWLLFGAVSMVLLIACANVANLLLARASARRREFAVRQALGAGVGRLMRQLLTESIVLSLAAGALGVLLASWSLAALVRFAPPDVPLMADMSIDRRVLFFSMLVSILTGLIFGIVPARQAARTDPQEILKDAGRSTTSGAHVHRWRHALVIAEFALALILLIGASLLVRSFTRLYAIDPGFDANKVLTARLWMSQPNDPSAGRYFTQPARTRFYQQALARIASRPEAEAAGWIGRLPLDGLVRGVPFMIEGRSIERGEVVSSEMTVASPGYFQALRIPLVRGRLFTEHDDVKAPPVIVISERFARRFFPGEDPIGRRIRPGRANSIAPWLTIVGIVSDVRSVSLGAEPEAQLYRCVWQGSGLVMALVVRGRASDTTLEQAIRSEVSAIDPELPLYAVRPMTSVIAQATAQRRFSMVLFGLFAGAALLLAALGIYAMMAYLVRQRSHEIGIRLALGARPADAIALVLRRGLALTLTGAAIGIAGGALVARMMAGLLFGVSVIDPVSFIAAPLILTLVSLAACYIPALRAAHIDPIQTLRAE